MVHSTLILNADCLPVSVVPLSTTTWQEAVKLLFIDRATVLEEYDDWQVHSPSLTMNVPAVILLKDYIKVRRTVKFSRENIFLRDKFECQYCGINCRHDTSQLTLDHVIPRFLGGATNYSNIVTSCASCNTEKSCTLQKPNTVPKRPTYWELAAVHKSLSIVVPDASWTDYIGWDRQLVKIVPPHKVAAKGETQNL